MKQFILTIATLLTYFSVLAQNVLPDKIKGEWTVKSVKLTADMGLDEDQLEMMESLKNGFINSKFSFNSDNTFQFKMSERVPAFMEELKFLDNKKWKIDQKSGKIVVGTEEDQYSLMSIFVKNQDGKIFFLLDETPLLLEMIKG